MHPKKYSGFVRYLVSMLCTVAVLFAVFVLWKGMPVFGVPDETEIASVTVTHSRYCPAGKTFTDAEKIHLAHNLASFLNRDLFAEPKAEEAPVVSITYTLRDGSTRTAAAGSATGWWNGKSRALKDPDTFVNLAEGIFFLTEIMQEESNASQSG